jgi:hypothetical protein
MQNRSLECASGIAASNRFVDLSWTLRDAFFRSSLLHMAAQRKHVLMIFSGGPLLFLGSGQDAEANYN